MIRDALVGCTGFVGSNLVHLHNFSDKYHSTDITSSYGTQPALLVYAGIPAEMFYANRFPDEDLKQIQGAMENIRRIKPKRLVLISTVAVFPLSCTGDEDTVPNEEDLTPYGRNRLLLEKWVLNNYKDSLVIRLPAIYGENLKKNFLYDYIHYIPTLVTADKANELFAQRPELARYYSDNQKGFFACRECTTEERKFLKSVFVELGFSALNFTDTRSRYQFYALRHLWNHMEIALSHNVRLLHLVTPPIQVSELHVALSGRSFVNELNKPPYDYNLKTKYSDLFGREDGYVMSKEQELEDIISFVRSQEALQ